LLDIGGGGGVFLFAKGGGGTLPIGFYIVAFGTIVLKFLTSLLVIYNFYTIFYSTSLVF